MPQTHRRATSQKFACLRRTVESKEKEMIMLKNELTETRAQNLASEAHCCNLETQLMIERDSFAQSIANLKNQKRLIETRVSVLREQLLEERGVWKNSIAELGEQFCKAEKSVMLRVRDLEAKLLETDEALIDANYSTDLAAELITDLSSENAAKESEICYLRAQIVQKEHSEASKGARKPMPMVSKESMRSSMLADSLRRAFSTELPTRSKGICARRGRNLPTRQVIRRWTLDRYSRSDPRKHCFS